MPFRIPRASEQGPLEIGDRLCDLGWRDRHGARLSLYEDAYSGRATLLAVFPSADAPGLRELAEALAGLQDRFRALEVQLFAVVGGDEGAAAPPELPVPLLIDEDFKIGRALAEAGREPAAGLLLLFDGTLRLEALFDAGRGAEAARAVLAHCEARAARLPSGPVMAQAPVLILSNLISPEHCRRLIAFWEGGARYEGGVAHDATGGNVPVSEVKVREDVALPDQGAEAQELLGLFKRRLFPEIEKAFNFRVTRWETLRMGCYDAARGGQFKAHRDDTTAFSAHRRFALSLFLNSGDYEGGALCFPEYGGQLYEPPAGGGVVFSCSLLHRVMPVTAGRRFGLFGFFFGEAEEAIRQRDRAARLQAASVLPPGLRGDGWPGRS